MGQELGYPGLAVTAKDKRAGRTKEPVLVSYFRGEPHRGALQEGTQLNKLRGNLQKAVSPAREGESPGRKGRAGLRRGGAAVWRGERPARRGTQQRGEPGRWRALCWEGARRPSGLLETRRIRFQINEIWVHTFALLLPALMLF